LFYYCAARAENEPVIKGRAGRVRCGEEDRIIILIFSLVGECRAGVNVIQLFLVVNDAAAR
jgi:hypothetical protein